MGERISDEVYECAGCAGEVPVVDAVWLPEPRPFEADASKARPYCCRECFEAHQKALAAQERADLRGEAEEAPRIEAAEAEAAASILLRAYGEWKDHKFPLCHESRSDYEKVLMRVGPALARYVLATRAALASAPGTGQDKAQPTPTSAPSSDVPTAAQERADLRGEADDMAYRFGCLLDHATGARLSKTNYPKEVMYNAVNEYVQRCCDKAVREAREEWEAEKPTSAPGGGEGPFSSDEALARFFHDTYERLAPSFGYETRPETRTFDPTSKNGRLMVAVARKILTSRPRPAPQPATGDGVREAAQALSDAAESHDADVNGTWTVTYRVPEKQMDRLRAALASEQAARAAAERERCPACNGELSECGEMTEDGPSLDCRACQLGSMVVEERHRAEAAEARAADAERRLGVAREALRSAEVMLRGARNRLAASGATMGVYDATLAEVQAALAALRAGEADGVEVGEKGAVV
jgi:hypothetical protein